ncbi:MAG TPA: class I SAM-dependent methyltransferase [Solirubrobacterales bacterium]|nr:class I SAM-dependent methyltransferase [Solirubrobacterales bacterium]
MEAQAAARSGSREAEQAYEAFAPVYDDFTANYDNEAWQERLLSELRRHGLSGHRLLDVGCGTGKSFLPMLERGWEVTACDISPSMLELAHAKVGDAVDLSVADMRKLPAFGEFDLVWALDDAVNYLLSTDELGAALGRMRANLAPDGLLMFDTNTLRAYRTFFAEEMRVERNDRTLVWRGRGSATAEPGSISEAAFEVEAAAGREPDVEPCVHRQRHFPEAEVLREMEGASLECVAIYGQGLDGIPHQPLDEATDAKAVYIARAA